jgi:hypothetical protein
MADPVNVGNPTPRLRDLSQMWSALLHADWNALAVVPADHEIDVGDVIEALNDSIQGVLPSVTIVDGRGCDATEGKRLASTVSSTVRGGTRVVVVTDSLLRSLASIHLVQAASSVLLVIRLGEMNVEALTSTVAAVGGDRVVGSVTASSDA